MAAGDKYRALHRRSLEDREGFWLEQTWGIDWVRRPAAQVRASRRARFP